MFNNDKDLSDLLTDERFRGRDLRKIHDRLKDEHESLTDAVREAEDGYVTAEEEFATANNALLAVIDAELEEVGVSKGDGDEDGLADAHQAVADAQQALADAEEELKKATDAVEEWLKENEEDLDALNDVENDYSNDTDFISVDSFEDYARELAEDLYGRELGETRWPFTCIDWEQAAKELTMDYSILAVKGEEFYTRD